MARQPLSQSEEETLYRIERNLFFQASYIELLVRVSGEELRFSAELVQELHSLAIRDIYECAGEFRTWPITIIGSKHVPPDGRSVAGLVQDTCDQINSAIREDPDNNDLTSTAAYLLWKLNWIHPFGGGNGRTSRAATYLLICTRLGFFLPGRLTLATYIVQNRRLYMDALVDADTAWIQSSVPDVSKLKSFLDRWLEQQLESVPPPPGPTIIPQSDDPSISEPDTVIHPGGTAPSLPEAE
jgi:fido (protein-threonine AMPylation protein)